MLGFARKNLPNWITEADELAAVHDGALALYTFSGGTLASAGITPLDTDDLRASPTFYWGNISQSASTHLTKLRLRPQAPIP